MDELGVSAEYKCIACFLNAHQKAVTRGEVFNNPVDNLTSFFDVHLLISPAIPVVAQPRSVQMTMVAEMESACEHHDREFLSQSPPGHHLCGVPKQTPVLSPQFSAVAQEDQPDT